MNLRDLKYLVTVAEIKHFGKAAELCHVSQPTLSMQLKKLEDTLGLQLFERSNRKVMLTKHGEQVVLEAKIALAACERMVQLARHAEDPESGELVLGIFPTLAPYLLPVVMPQIGRQFPRLSLRLVEEKTDQLLTKLESGAIDAAILALPVMSPALSYELLFDEPFLLAVSDNHPLSRKKRIQFDDLDGQALLLLDDGHCLREQALEVCQRVGASESQSFRATSLETLRHMVAAGGTMTLMPKLATKQDRGIVYVPFAKPPWRRIALCWRKTSHQALLMKHFAELIQKIMK
ncbi:MAG: LysR substrate-binding domain-containing protein [Rickettsiales bacterium]|jgi:LysR family hydrogen peroxide-inducible transcriptional activator|nr:LysR substrate-binding domain-containing protein [Rickettsiales bacterium]